MNKRKYILTLIAILVVVTVLVTGGTYAYWTWNSDVTKNVVFNTSKGISEYIVYDEGDSFFIGDFQPQSSFCQGASTTLSFYKTSEVVDVPLTATINMDVNHIDSVVASSSAVHWIITKGDNTISCSSLSYTPQIINHGTFDGITSGETITLTSNQEIKTTEQKFTVWIWIDSTGSNLSSLTGKTIDTNVWTQIDMLHSEPETPTLDAGMIPVTIKDDGTVTTISQNNPDWYSYSNKQWANAVLVKESGTQTREYYKNNSGKVIPQDDILAYYVWIPRYKYRIWSLGTTATGGEQTIDIIFENKNTTVSTGTNVGSWRTHPAFIWDGTPVAGIWVGKFETSHSTLSPTNALGCTNENCANADGILIKDLLQPIKNNSISDFFYASRSMSRSGNPFGLNISTSDTHMMKNSEWGAVAYLSHSQYGLNDRIITNEKTITSCGNSGDMGEDIAGGTWCPGYFRILSNYPQSTTGNITGIFDMSGGAGEYVMGNYSNNIGNSGFTTMPASKYYDNYTSYLGTSISGCSNTEICFGDALVESLEWYPPTSQDKQFITADSPWYIRGYPYNAFVFNYHDGSAGWNVTFRSVIVNE